MDTDSFKVYIKTENIYIFISKDVEISFDTSNYELDSPLPKVKSKNVIELVKDELDRKIMKGFAALRAKTYSYLTDSKDVDKKAKDAEKCVIKRKLKCEDCQHFQKQFILRMK